MQPQRLFEIVYLLMDRGTSTTAELAAQAGSVRAHGAPRRGRAVGGGRARVHDARQGRRRAPHGRLRAGPFGAERARAERHHGGAFGAQPHRRLRRGERRDGRTPRQAVPARERRLARHGLLVLGRAAELPRRIRRHPQRHDRPAPAVVRVLRRRGQPHRAHGGARAACVQGIVVVRARLVPRARGLAHVQAVPHRLGDDRASRPTRSRRARCPRSTRAAT